jgi:hypothetical protein
MTETSRATFARAETVHRHETGLLDPTDHQLGDPISAADLVRRSGVRVHKYDHNLATVTRVDQARRVEASDSVAGRETASRQHEAGIALGNLERDPCRDRRTPTAWSESRVEPRDQVATRVAGPRVARCRKVLVETNQWNLEHDSAP